MGFACLYVQLLPFSDEGPSSDQCAAEPMQMSPLLWQHSSLCTCPHKQYFKLFWAIDDVLIRPPCIPPCSCTH